MPRKALVTGAAGFIGKHVTALLLADGWDVAGLDLLPRTQDLECAWHQTSILDISKLKAAMRGCDTVFHLAARAHLFAKDPAVFDHINHHGTRAVLSAAQDQGVAHLIATLSAVALTPVGFKGLVDTAAARPLLRQLAGPYAASKWRADAALSQVAPGGMSITKVFPTVPIGPGDNAYTAPTQMIRMFLTNPPPAILDTALNLVCVKDVARAHIAAAQTLNPELNNECRQYLLAGERWPLSQILSQLERIADRPMPKRSIPYAIARVAASVSERSARLRGTQSLATVEGVRLAKADADYNTQPAIDDLGWNPTPVSKAIESVVHWLSSQQGNK